MAGGKGSAQAKEMKSPEPEKTQRSDRVNWQNSRTVPNEYRKQWPVGGSDGGGAVTTDNGPIHAVQCYEIIEMSLTSMGGTDKGKIPKPKLV